MLVSRLSPEQWRVISVLACERKLTQSALDRLGLSTELRQWLMEGLGQGLWLDGGIVYGLPYTRSFTGERAIAIAPAQRALILRQIAAKDWFSATRADARVVVGDGSIAGFTTALYAGDLRVLQREVSELMLRSMRGEEATLVRGRLLEALCLPFDADFLMRTWGDSAWSLVEQVLSDARVALDPVEELYRWAIAQGDARMSARLLRLLAEHAFIRGDTDALAAITERLPVAEQFPLRAAQYVLLGEPSQAQALLSDFGGKNLQKLVVPWPISIIALLSLLALGRDSTEGPVLTRRLLQRLAVAESPAITGWPTPPQALPVTRAIRSLLRRMTQPDSERLRLSAHHQPIDAPAWETLILALTVQLEDCDAVTRLGWTRRLIADAKRWNDAGYNWMARQALHLGLALSPEAASEVDDLLPRQSGELLLASLLEREPDWRRALRALEQFADTAERRTAIVSRRVAWFLDMASGELAKPALEEYRAGTGWTRGHRVDFEALRSIKATLPPEDAAVLTAMDAAPKSSRLPPEALEALCGHPRVLNGARGRQPVEVVRGHCRIETREERGDLLIQIEPSGAPEGVTVVVESETRVMVYRVDAALAKLIALLQSGLRIPLSQKNEGLVVLARLAEHVEIQSPELGAMRTVTADSNPCLRISPEAGAWWLEIGVRPFGELGRFFPPGLGRSAVSVHSGEDLLDTERNFSEEKVCFDSLVAQCPTLGSALLREAQANENAHESQHGVSLGEEELFSLLVELRETSQNYSLEWKNSRAISARGKVTAASLQGSLRCVKGWYLVNGQIKLEAVTPVALADLVRMPFTKSGRFIRLPTGDFVEVERRIQQVLSKLKSLAQLPARGTTSALRVPEAAFDVLRSLVDAESSIEIDHSATEWLSRLDAILATQPALPEGLRAILRPYQFEGFQWLSRYSQLGLGVCLADDMGLGKTLQVIALLLTRADGGPALVIAPTSVCSNWLDELKRFAPTLSAIEYTGKSRAALLEQFGPKSDAPAPNVLIASYALLQHDAAGLGSVQWNTAVLDEAQFIKNPHSLRAKAAFQLSARYRVAMTGTPIENHLGDLWSIFHFLNPALLGSFKHFQLCYLKPIERDHDSDQQTLLKKLVQPFLLRRRKDEVLPELPPITTLCHHVRLSKDEGMRYALLRRQIHDKLYTTHGKREHKLQVLAEITRLRRFCCHPRLVFPDAPTESSKMQAFLLLAEELRDNGHRALVFSQFVDFLQLVREQLDERGFRYQYLDGSTPKENRHSRVQAFQAGEAGLFLISLKAGGFGLNLTGADYVIHLDPWWNPAVEAQATDRAHRIGQERPVTVYRLVTKDSIEERIVELHQEKRAIADALLNDSDIAAELSSEELVELLRLE